MPINEAFQSKNNFFSRFKSQYALQGISNNFLNKLEGRKPTILSLINQDDLSKLYFDFFAKAEIQKEGNGKIVRKSLGSFFTKLVHTFKPNEYCALDNPIKNLFDLKNESFYISFIVISQAYKKWIATNPQELSILKIELRKRDKNNTLQLDKLSDLKLLDLVFWTKANPPK